MEYRKTVKRVVTAGHCVHFKSRRSQSKQESRVHENYEKELLGAETGEIVVCREAGTLEPLNIKFAYFHPKKLG